MKKSFIILAFLIALPSIAQMRSTSGGKKDMSSEEMAREQNKEMKGELQKEEEYSEDFKEQKREEERKKKKAQLKKVEEEATEGISTP